MAISRKSIDSQSTLVSFASAQNALAHNSLYMRKRFLVPGWWTRGYLMHHQSADIVLFSQPKYGCLTLMPPELSPKYFSLIAAIWTEITRLLIASSQETFTLKIDLHNLLRGTSTELTEQLNIIESYWATPIRLVRQLPKATAKRTSKKSATIGEASFNFVKHSCVIKSDYNCFLQLDLNISLKDLCRGKIENTSINNNTYEDEDFVSLNPDVLRSLNTGKSDKKLCSYLAIEYGKRFLLDPTLDTYGWKGGILDYQHLSSYHKDILSKTKSLYDHGIFGWKNTAPLMRISKIKSLLQQQNIGNNNTSGALHFICLSEHLIKARQTEASLYLQQSHATITSDTTLYRKPAEIKKPLLQVCALPVDAPTIIETKIEMKIKPIPEAPKIIKPPEMPKPINIEHNFIVKIANYYESLSENCKQAFDKQRNTMTPEEFREFMSPLLQIRCMPKRKGT